MNSCNSRYLVCIFQLTLSQGWRGTPRGEARGPLRMGEPLALPALRGSYERSGKA